MAWYDFFKLWSYCDPPIVRTRKTNVPRDADVDDFPAIPDLRDPIQPVWGKQGEWVLYDMNQPKPLTLRSSHWAKVRQEHLKTQGSCQVCGSTDNLNVHHIQPVHLKPELELEPTNLITLCEGGHPYHFNCHFMFGHLASWYSYNESVIDDSHHWKEKITKRP